MWDRNEKTTEKGQIFMGEVKLSIVEYADVNFEYCEPRPYKLEPRGKAAKSDMVKGDLTVKVGMVLPKKSTPAKGTAKDAKDKTTEELYVDSRLCATRKSLTPISIGYRNLKLLWTILGRVYSDP